MIGEYATDGGIGSKKRSLTSPGVTAISERFIMSPPTKKLKQARLPFKVISSPSPNQCSPSPATDTVASKKRKLSGADNSPTSSQPTKAKSGDSKTSTRKPADNPAKKFFAKKAAAPPVTPKKSRLETIDLDPEVTSSCEDQEAVKVASSSTTPKRSLSSKPKSLDSYLQITQQPQVSTSDDVIDISDDEIASRHINESPGKENHGDEPTAAGTGVANVESLQQDNSQPAVPSQKESAAITASETDGAAETDRAEAQKQDPSSELDVSAVTCADDSNTASKLGYDADSEDGNDDDEADPRIVKSSEGSSEAESSTGGSASKACSLTPRSVGKPVQKTPLSAKALKKLHEKEQQREEKIKLRMEKKRKLEEEEAERKRLKLELKNDKEQEREEARRLKELEKDEKRKEKQQKKEQEEKEKEKKKMVKEEDRKKKQEIIDAKMEEKRKKNEERQRQEEEKQKQEDEKHQKEVKQMNLFKSFFKEVAVPVKKPQEKSCGWFAPFQVKDDMVLAPLRRSERLLEVSEEFEAAFEDQNASSLYLDELRSKTAGKMGRTLKAMPEEKDCNSRTTTPSVETMQQDVDSPDVQIVSKMDAKPAKKLMRMKCKLFQFHENYRPSYYGTWRQKSRAVNPRNYLKKDEDLLDYEVDSDDEWEEPGESLSHSEGEEDGEDAEDAGDSDDGFFVPHGYLSESEGCEDEEEAENWKERRAAKAKSWEVELKRQQGVPLKPILVGCVWLTDSTKPSANKLLNAYKIVALTTVPIDTRSKKQIMASSEVQSKEDSSKLSVQSKGSGGEGVSLKRPVPAEAMPDLICLVHGNTAGIRTLQREFREYWRLKDLRKTSGQSTPRPETPSTTAAAEASQPVKSSVEVSRSSAAQSPLLCGSAVVDVNEKPALKTEQSPVPSAACLQTPGQDSTPGSDGGTPEFSNAGQTSLMSSVADAIECSISKRQLLLTIGAIAVRERRPAFPRTCWYVHQHLLEKHNLQNLPIPSQWQNITKPQKALRAESPLVGHSLSAYGTQTPASYSVPAQAGLPVVIQRNPMAQGIAHQSLSPALYAPPNSSVRAPQLSGMPYETHVRLQGNTVQQSIAGRCTLNPLAGVNLQLSTSHQSSGVALPLQLQVANGMSACEIMQRLSATIPMQHNQALATTPSPAQAHVFNPISSNSRMHYLNMLPKPAVVPYAATPAVGLSSTSQIHKADTSHAVKVPRTSPTDIKAMLASQTAKLPAASPTTVNQSPVPSPTIPASQAAPSSKDGPGKSPMPSPNCQEESAISPSSQQPVKKTATLKSFFNVKPLPKSRPNPVEISDAASASKETDSSSGNSKVISVTMDSPVTMDSVTKIVTAADSEENVDGQNVSGKQETEVGGIHKEKTEVIEII